MGRDRRGAAPGRRARGPGAARRWPATTGPSCSTRTGGRRPRRSRSSSSRRSASWSSDAPRPHRDDLPGRPVPDPRHRPERVAQRDPVGLPAAREAVPPRRGRRSRAAAVPRDPGGLRAARRLARDGCDRRPGGTGRVGAPREPWRADSTRARASREAWRARRAGRVDGGRRPDDRPATSGRRGTRRARAPRRAATARPAPGARRRRGSATRAAASGRRPRAPRPTTRPPRRRSTPSGRAARGTARRRGTYWTINPREYADPRKHGPEYQARARRAARAEADGTSEAAASGGPSAAAGARHATPPRTRPRTGPAPRRRARIPPSATGAGAAPSRRPPTAATPAGGRTAGPTRRRPTTPRPRRTRRRSRHHDRRRRRARSSRCPTSRPSPAGRRRANLLALARRPGWRWRLVIALIAWPPVGYGVGTLISTVTGCAQFSASCPEPLPLLSLAVQPLDRRRPVRRARRPPPSARSRRSWRSPSRCRSRPCCRWAPGPSGTGRRDPARGRRHGRVLRRDGRGSDRGLAPAPDREDAGAAALIRRHVRRAPSADDPRPYTRGACSAATTPPTSRPPPRSTCSPCA